MAWPCIKGSRMRKPPLKPRFLVFLEKRWACHAQSRNWTAGPVLHCTLHPTAVLPSHSGRMWPQGPWSHHHILGSSHCLFLFFLADEFKCPIKEEMALTSGEWEVLARHGSKVPSMGPAHLWLCSSSHGHAAPPHCWNTQDPRDKSQGSPDPQKICVSQGG
jgi:hypothetical protein